MPKQVETTPVTPWVDASSGQGEAHVPGFELAGATANPLSLGARLGWLIGAIVLAFVGFSLEHYGHLAPDSKVALPWVIPFVTLLAAIAVMPFIARHWWEHHYAKVAIVLGLIVAAYYLVGPEHGAGNVARTTAEYISFIFLVGSLYVVSGGILIRVHTDARPLANVTLLLLGAINANIFGTTGAAMLLIRPYMRMNRDHLKPYHIVFFIFIVANAGGSLTPIGDPPLFLGFLKGVPFWWVMENCWPIWITVVGMLLAIFFVVDSLDARKRKLSDTPRAGADLGPGVSLYGASNLVWAGLIIAGILMHGPLNHWTHEHFGFHAPFRELAMALAAFLALSTTPRRVHVENQFNYAPIKEVAILFVGIFLTMLPALNYLYHASAAGRLPLKSPSHYYFAVGSLSSVLDNAPTYLTFLKAKLGSLDQELIDREWQLAKDVKHDLDAATVGLSEVQRQQVDQGADALAKYFPQQYERGEISREQAEIGLLVGVPELNRYLVAISMAAVLFGAMTYIGNGPNFMIKSIAEHGGVKMPSFFGYVFRYALPALLPILIIVWAIFI